MIRIGKPKNNLKLPLGPGAWLIYREATSVDREAARYKAREALDDDPSNARVISAYIAELSFICISQWEGIGDEIGQPLPLMRENVAALLEDDDIKEAIFSAISARLIIMDAEGNASAPLPNGAAAGASPIAEPAAN